MTAPTRRTASSLERELSEIYRADRPPAHVIGLIDGRVATALERYRARPACSPHRTLLLAASVSLVAALAFAGGAVAQRIVSEDGIVIVDGIVFREGVIERPD